MLANESGKVNDEDVFDALHFMAKPIYDFGMVYSVETVGTQLTGHFIIPQLKRNEIAANMFSANFANDSNGQQYHDYFQKNYHQSISKVVLPAGRKVESLESSKNQAKQNVSAHGSSRKKKQKKAGEEQQDQAEHNVSARGSSKKEKDRKADGQQQAIDSSKKTKSKKKREDGQSDKETTSKKRKSVTILQEEEVSQESTIEKKDEWTQRKKKQPCQKKSKQNLARRKRIEAKTLPPILILI
jgi:hypothetical protein